MGGMKTSNVISQISKIKEQANAYIMDELRKNDISGLVPSHGDILMVLFHQEDVTMKMLADKIHRTKPTVTVLVNKLVALGLVKKEESEEDARVSYVRLTDKGRGFQDVFYNISLHLAARLFQGFSDNEQKQLENLLGRVLENMQ